MSCRMLNQGLRWIKDYERSRFKESKVPNESWISTKYDFQNTPWKILQKTYVPELKMRIGSAISAIKKNWKLYRMDDGREPRSSIAFKIVRLESGLGLEKSIFPELEGINLEEEFPSEEESQLRREEQVERDQEVSWDSWTAEDSEDDGDRDFKKSKLGEQEENDWWIF
jgi:hypothetical protein